MIGSEEPLATLAPHPLVQLSSKGNEPGLMLVLQHLEGPHVHEHEPSGRLATREARELAGHDAAERCGRVNHVPDCAGQGRRVGIVEELVLLVPCDVAGVDRVDDVELALLAADPTVEVEWDEAVPADRLPDLLAGGHGVHT